MKLKAITIKISKRKLAVSRLGILFIILTIIGLVHQAGIFGGYYLTAIITSFLLFLMGAMKYALNSNKIRLFISGIWEVGVMLLIPWAVFFVHNIIIYICGHGSLFFLKSSFVQIMFTPVILLGALGSYYIFKKNTLKYFLYAIFIHYIIVLLFQLINLGPSEFFQGSLSLIMNKGLINPFETNSDLVLALGLLLIYYNDNFIKKKTNERTYGLSILVLILLGGKRIEVLAIGAIVLASFVTQLMIEKKRNRMQFIISIVIAVLLYFFVFLVVSGMMSVFVYSYGINTMGRIKMWEYIAQFAEFSPTYMGKGHSFSNLTLEVERIWTWNGHTYGLHSDVLKVYFDLGFVMFSFWIIYNLFYLPRKIRNLFGYRIGNLFWFLTAYLFVLYVTDNCINYYATQMMYVFIILKSIELEREYALCARMQH